MGQSCSIVQNLVANYHLVTLYPQQCYFGINVRSSRPEMFGKEGVFRNFAKFTGEHLCQSLFFNKVAC